MKSTVNLPASIVAAQIAVNQKSSVADAYFEIEHNLGTKVTEKTVLTVDRDDGSYWLAQPPIAGAQ